MLFLSESEVRELLPMAKAIELMEGLFNRLAAGTALNQPRRRLTLPTGSTLHYMAGADGKYFGTKIYSTHPKYGAHFLFLLYAVADATPLAIFEANYLGQIRTGAASGYATKVLARPDAENLERAGVAQVDGRHGDVPAGHHLVEQPAAGAPHRLGRTRGDRGQPLPQRVPHGGLMAS